MGTTKDLLSNLLKIKTANHIRYKKRRHSEKPLIVLTKKIMLFIKYMNYCLRSKVVNQDDYTIRLHKIVLWPHHFVLVYQSEQNTQGIIEPYEKKLYQCTQWFLYNLLGWRD